MELLYYISCLNYIQHTPVIQRLFNFIRYYLKICITIYHIKIYHSKQKVEKIYDLKLCDSNYIFLLKNN